MGKIEFASADLTMGQINSLVKKIMTQMGIKDPVEAIRRINSGEWTLVGPTAGEKNGSVIDLSQDPFVPQGLSVESHQRGDRIDVADIPALPLYLSEGQKKGVVSGNELRKELDGKPVFSAVMLDWLLAHPERIPDSWKGKYVFFWGTIYRYSIGDLYVRYLSWDGSRWDWHYRWLDNVFHSGYPAVVASLT